MTNLQRVPIVDKNGKATTVHRKTSSTPVARSWTPPRTPQQLQERKDTITKLANTLFDTVYGEDGDPEYYDISEFRASLMKCSNETLAKINALFDDHSSGFRYNGGIHHNVASMIEEGASGNLVDNLVTYMPRFTQLTVVAYSYYQEHGVIDWELNDSTDPLMVALETTAGVLDDLNDKPMAIVVGATTNWGVSLIRDPKIANLVLDRIEDNARINDIIRDRKSADYDVIIAALDETPSALSNGVI